MLPPDKARKSERSILPLPPKVRKWLAQAAMDSASNQLSQYALSTDCPEFEVVEAADLLDAARRLLGGVQ